MTRAVPTLFIQPERRARFAFPLGPQSHLSNRLKTEDRGNPPELPFGDGIFNQRDTGLRPHHEAQSLTFAVMEPRLTRQVTSCDGRLFGA